VYKWNTAVVINGGVTLRGGPDDVFILQVSKGIKQAADTRITLTGGVQAKKIFWQAGETVAIGTRAHFAGIVLGKTNVSLGNHASINGRLLAQTAVALIMSAVVAP
jgi:Ice-binding-like